jgi:hypothetical protein
MPKKAQHGVFFITGRSLLNIIDVLGARALIADSALSHGYSRHPVSSSCFPTNKRSAAVSGM